MRGLRAMCWLVTTVCAMNATLGTCEDEARTEEDARAPRAPSAFTHLQELYRDCVATRVKEHPAEECVARKVLLGLDSLSHRRSIPLWLGLRLDADEADATPLLTPPALEESLEEAEARGAGGRSATLYSMIGDRLVTMARTRSLSLKLATAADAIADANADAHGEARGTVGLFLKARRYLLPFMAGVFLKLVLVLPLLLSSMGVLALKALGASKLAILVTGLISLRRLLSGGDSEEVATAAEGPSGIAGGYQLEKSYALLNPHAPAAYLDYEPHDVYHAHHAAYAAAPHPAAYYAHARAIRVGPSNASTRHHGIATASHGGGRPLRSRRVTRSARTAPDTGEATIAAVAA